MKLKHLFMPLTGLAFISLASPSYAFDYKVYPGAGCQPSTSGQAFRADSTGFTNTSTGPETVVCPIVRDRVRFADLLDPAVRVASSNGALLLCSFHSLNIDGGRVADSVPVFQATTSSVVNSLFFGLATLAIPNVQDGTYVIECLLPPNGRVVNYTLGENGETSNGE